MTAFERQPDESRLRLIGIEVDSAVVVGVGASRDELSVVFADDFVNGPVDALTGSRAIVNRLAATAK